MNEEKINVILCPWVNYEEWEFVYKGLEIYSDIGNFLELPCLKNSIKIMESWALRGNIPPTIESTLNIVRILYDIHSKNNMNGNNIKLTLSSIIIRFVNEVIEPYQQNSYALPISQLAHKIGISKMIVDVRHDATHDKLPSTDMLIICVKECLEWIIINYWKPQTEWKYIFSKSIKEFYHSFLDVIIKKDYDLLKKPSVNEVANKNIIIIEQSLPGISSDITLQKIFFLEIFKFSLDKNIINNPEYIKFEETPNVSFIKSFISSYPNSITSFVEIIDSTFFNSCSEKERNIYFSILKKIIPNNLCEFVHKKIRKILILSDSSYVNQISLIFDEIIFTQLETLVKDIPDDWGYCSNFNPSFKSNWKSLFSQSCDIKKIN